MLCSIILVSTRKHRLSKMLFDFVSLVPAGDDPMAQVVISKTAPVPADKENEMPDIKKDDLAPEVAAYIDELEAENDELSKALAASDADVDTLSEDQLLAKADPAIARLIKSQKAALEASEAIVKAERDERLTRDYISKAEKMPLVGTDRAEFGGLLKRISEVVSKEDATALEGILTAANAQIEKGDLFREQGRYGEPATITASATAAAAEIRKNEPGLTEEQAIVKAMEQNPELFEEAMKEEV